MRANKKKQLVQKQRKALEAERSVESKVRKEKRGLARKQEQANYQKTRARAATRLGGRRKQTQAELHDKIEE